MARPKAPMAEVSKGYVSDRQSLIEEQEKAHPDFVYMWRRPDVTAQELAIKGQEIVTEKMCDPEGSDQPKVLTSDKLVRVKRDVWMKKMDVITERSYNQAKSVLDEKGMYDGIPVSEDAAESVGRLKPKGKTNGKR